MAKNRGKSKSQRRPRPLLSAALFCEKVLRENDNVATLIRVVDILNVPKPEVPAERGAGKATVKFLTQIMAFISFKAGEAKGEYDLQITVVSPSGKRRKMSGSKMTFLGGEQGFNIAATVQAPIEEEGVYWYELRVDKRLVTRMPLRIVHSTPKSSDGPAFQRLNRRESG